MELMEVFLKIALRQGACPVCHVCREQESRYLRFLLHEHVNDLSARLHLSRSLGFCRYHSWQLLNMEIEHWGVPLGTGIIYEDLLNQVIRRAESVLSAIAGAASRRSRHRLIDRFRLWMRASRPARDVLEPAGACRVCTSSSETAQHAVQVMLKMFSSSEMQQLYVESEGLCLPHLRLLLSAGEISPGLLFLMKNTLERLRTLQNDLNEFKRKQHWHYRDEKISESEKTSVRRAVAFFVGEQ